MTRLIVFALFCFSFCGVKAQEVDAVLALFDIKQVNNRVEVTVAIRGGASCNGVQLERKALNNEFEVIDSYPGTCGGTAFTEYYYLTDSQPIEGAWSTYRLHLGQVGLSEEVLFLFVPSDESKITVYPNPALAVLHVFVENTEYRSADFEVICSSGTPVLSGSFRAERHSIDLPTLRPGVYYLRLVFDNGELRFKRFIVN